MKTIPKISTDIISYRDMLNKLRRNMNSTQANSFWRQEELGYR